MQESGLLSLTGKLGGVVVHGLMASNQVVRGVSVILFRATIWFNVSGSIGSHIVGRSEIINDQGAKVIASVNDRLSRVAMPIG